jgi:Peptidase family C25
MTQEQSENKMLQKLRIGLFPFCVTLVFLAWPDACRAQETTSRQVIVAGALPDEAVIQLSSLVAAAGGEDRMLLLDSTLAAKGNEAVLAAFRPGEVIGVLGPDGLRPEVEGRLGRKLDEVVEWTNGPPAALRQKLLPRAERVVVCPATPRRLLLHGAWLAGLMQAPLFVTRGAKGDGTELQGWLGERGLREVIGIGEARPLCRACLASSSRSAEPALTQLRLVELADETAVNKACRSRRARSGPIQTVIVANPSDCSQGLGRMSLLAPWLAVVKRAALLLTSDKGDNAGTVVSAALTKPDLARVETMLLLAGLKAIPTEHRVNPVPGKDAEIEMEPLTPRGNEPFSLATGRLFHQDLALVLLQLARQQLLPSDLKRRRALVVSNPGGGLPLLETFSRHTANELRNGGYKTTALFNNEADKDKMRKLLPEQDVFLWEGHYKTLTDEYGFLTWTEPLPPAFYFLQSCLALKEEEASPLVQRGAFAIVGSATRTYSASGGAFTVAFFDAMIYEQQTLGASLRQAKNFLLCYSLLKEKRLGDKVKLAGANVRSAWAFTLWGDPTLRLPRPERPAPGKELQAVRHEVRGNSIYVMLPEKQYPTVKVGKYEANMLPNARLAGLLTASMEDEDQKNLVPFVFAEVQLPKAPAGMKPALSSRLSEKSYVFTWDERRKTGYLLVTPRNRDQRELRFKVDWID